MLLTITTPEQFKQVPWKNGKGVTAELAINEGADMSNFAWRISKACVVEDGPFSFFPGYTRHLVLLEGAGIDLIIGDQSLTLNKPLDIAVFDGAQSTSGRLHQGAITDFNVIFNPLLCNMETRSFTQDSQFTLTPPNEYFIYAAHTAISVHSDEGLSQTQTIAAGCLVHVSELHHAATVHGECLIVIRKY
ncbi:HutD family protein [Pseudoalteromonas fenneropenaei]|uniref:HutD family protein n=1 Tax=Pseudoalteromonas fenneropenaei TaxID=1737459 RepID=A0ABV7CC59_9GAMM